MGRSQHLKAVVLISIALAVAIGCTHGAKTVSFQFVDPVMGPAGGKNTDKYRIKRGDTVFIDAKPIEPLTLPHYPTIRSPSSADPVRIVVRIVVEADGTVEDVERSIADFSPSTPFARACFESVKAVVVQWKFEPAQIAVVEPQPNGRPMIVSSTPTDRPFEVAFTFSASGRVTPEFAKK